MNLICNVACVVLFALLSCNQAREFSPAYDLARGQQRQDKNDAVAAKMVFKSTDGGRTWQDISEGLPGNLREDTIRANDFFANDTALFLRGKSRFYHNTANATAPFWHQTIPGRMPGFAATTYNYWGVNLKKTDGTNIWSPVFNNFSEPRIRSVFQTAGGTIFIGTDKGFFKTANNGKTWKHVYSGGWAGNMAESNGVLISTSKRRIIRSTDDGENWSLINEGGVTWDVKRVISGFAAITSASASDRRSLRTSYDGGKTWQATDNSLQNKAVIDSIWRTWDDRPRVQAVTTSIVRVGENFFCTHPDGIFRSADNGTTWTLLLAAVEGKVFNIFVSGNVIYAIPSKGGC